MSARWNSSAGIIDFWKVYKSKHLCTLKKLEATVVVSKPVLCVWNPCQNQLKYWWNLYFSNFVHWKMVYAVAALQIYRFCRGLKFVLIFQTLQKEFKTNVIGMCTYMYMYVIWIKGIWGSFMMHFKECIWEARFETNCNRLEKGAVRLKSEWAGKLVLESTGCPNQQNQVDCWKYEIWMVEQICSWARLHGQRRSHICLNPKR